MSLISHPTCTPEQPQQQQGRRRNPRHRHDSLVLLVSTTTTTTTIMATRRKRCLSFLALFFLIVAAITHSGANTGSRILPSATGFLMMPPPPNTIFFQHRTIIPSTGSGGSGVQQARHSSSSSLFVLFAKKAGGMKRKDSKKGSSSSSSSGGGFGAPTASASNSSASAGSSSSSSKSQSLQGKIRTVSGFSGSGTKPLRQAANTFDAIRKEHGPEACWDLYVKSPLDDPYRLWFVGKIAVMPDNNTAATTTTTTTPTQAVLAQKRIILEYSKRELRPQNLGLPKYADTLELWLAPGDSEMECVQNKVSLTKVEGSIADLVHLTDFSVSNVGYNPEIYVGDEREKGGLRITRDENGDPIKPVFEVNQSA